MIRRIHTRSGPTDLVHGAHQGRLLVIVDAEGESYVIDGPMRAAGREFFRELLAGEEVDRALLETNAPAGYGGARRDTAVWVGFYKDSLTFYLESLPTEKESSPLLRLSWREAKTILWALETESKNR